MKKLAISSCFLTPLLLISCSNNAGNNKSFTFGAHYCNEESIYNSLTSSSGNWAYSIERWGEDVVQDIYIWDHEIRNELRKDFLGLYEIASTLDAKKGMLSFNVDSSILYDGKEYAFASSNFTANTIFKNVFPISSIEPKSLQELSGLVAITLEAPSTPGYSELVQIRTICNEGLPLLEDGLLGNWIKIMN